MTTEPTTPDENPTTPEPTPAAPEPTGLTKEEKDGFRRQLSEQAAKIKEYEDEKRAREEAKLAEAGEHEKLIASLREQLQSEKDAKAAAEKARKDSELSIKLAQAGATHERDLFWLKSKYDGEKDMATFVNEMKEAHPDSFVQTPVVKGAGAHQGPSSTPTTGHEKLLEDLNSKDNATVAAATEKVLQLNRDGKLTPEQAKVFGF
jgi:hypothetical protein